MNVWITGTSSGLGKALAESLLNGHSVTGFSRRPATIHHPRYQHVCLDLEQIDQIATTIQTTISTQTEKHNLHPKDRYSIDLLILNAAVLGPVGDLQSTPIADVEATMSVNVWSNKVIIDTLFESEKQGAIKAPSQIIAISSGASKTGSRGWNTYSISKAALNMMIELYAAEEPGRKFISLAPGLAHTPMQDLIATKDDTEFPPAIRLKAARGTPMMPTAEEVANRIIASLQTIFSHQSGSYVDLRNI